MIKANAMSFKPLSHKSHVIDFVFALICLLTALFYLLYLDWNRSLEYPGIFIWALICFLSVNLRELHRDGYTPSPIFLSLVLIQFYTICGPLIVSLTGIEPSPRVVFLVFGGQCWQYALAACVTAMLLFWAGYLGSICFLRNKWIVHSTCVTASNVGLFCAIVSFAMLLFIAGFMLSRSIFSGNYAQIFFDFESRAVATVWAFFEALFCIGLAHYLCIERSKHFIRNPATSLILGYGILVFSMGMRQRFIGLILTIYLVSYSRINKLKMRLILPIFGGLIAIALLVVGFSRFSTSGVMPELISGRGFIQMVNSGMEETFDALLYTSCEPTSVTARTIFVYGDRGTDYGLFYLLLIQKLLPREVRFISMPHENINMDIAYNTISWASSRNYTMGGSPVAEILRSFGHYGLILFILFGLVFRFARDGQNCVKLTWGKMCVVLIIPLYVYVSRNATDFSFNLICAFLFSMLCHYFAARMFKRGDLNPAFSAHDLN